jgi:hypothetical protein
VLWWEQVQQERPVPQVLQEQLVPLVPQVLPVLGLRQAHMLKAAWLWQPKLIIRL